MKTLLTAAALSFGLAVSAQSYNDLIEVVRSDVRTEHQAIVLANLNLTEAQSAAFTPIWDEYSAELKKHWDKRIALIKDYAAKYQTMNDEAAASLMKRMVVLEKENIALRDKYSKKVMKVLPTTVAARWMQIERRLGMLVELQLADEIPMMPKGK
jgi:Spy/CpxP family protein refolding chaperone